MDSISDFVADFYIQILPWLNIRRMETDPEVLQNCKKEKLLPIVESKIPYFVDYLKQAKSGYYVKSGITFVDFLCSELLSIVQDFEPDIFDPYPEVANHIKRIHSIPQLRDYVSIRKLQN